MITIKPYNSHKDLKDLHKVITESFKTVADDMGLNENNAPTNPAFRSKEDYRKQIDNGSRYFIAWEEDKPVGCISIEKSRDKENWYYIERLAVLPKYRHKGYGKLLLDKAIEAIKQEKANTVSIGMINENTVLKNWYINYGFEVTELKKFDHLPFTVCFMKIEL